MATPPAVVITVDPAQVERIQRELSGVKNGLQRALVDAINKVLPKGRTVAVNGLAALLTVKRSNIFKRTNVERANRSKPFGIVRIMGRRIGLINFEHKDTRTKKAKKKWGDKSAGRGVIARAYKGGAQEVFPHAFVAVGRRAAKTGEGNKHVFERAKTGGKRAPRLPIWSRRGLSLLDVYKEHPELVRETERKIQESLAEAVESQVDRILGRRKADRPTAFPASA